MKEEFLLFFPGLTTITQKVRYGDQQDLKISNLLNIAEACGYHLYLEKGEKRIEI